MLKQKKQFQKDLEALEAQAESLSPKERRQLDTLLSKVKQPPEARGQTSREKQTGSEAKDFDPKQYRHFPEKELPAGEERVELPKNLRKLLEDAQVLDAVPWDGQPASPTAGSFPEETKESQLRVKRSQAFHLPRTADCLCNDSLPPRAAVPSKGQVHQLLS